MEDSIRQGLFVSFSGHIALAALLTVKLVFFPTEKIDYRAAVRVDIVDLPDILPKKPPTHTSPEATDIQELSTPEKKIPAKKIIVPTPPQTAPTRVETQKIESAASAAIKKLRAQKAFEKIKQMKQQDEAKQPGPSKDVRYAGNILSAGSQLTGLQAVQMDNFVSLVDAHVKKFWILPEWMAQQKNLKAQIRVKIDSNGNVLDTQIIQSSRSKSYDDWVVEAIRKSDPFPEPPAKFRDIVEVKGIVLGFPE